MPAPTTFDVARFLATAFGLSEGDGLGAAPRRALQRASQTPDTSRPGTAPLDEALGHLAEALCGLAGPPGSAGDRVAGQVLYEGSVLYGRLRFYLDLSARPSAEAASALLSWFAIPLLGVTVGEHLEAYLAGDEGAPRVPADPLFGQADVRPTARALRGFKVRCGATSWEDFGRRLGWPGDLRRFSEWIAPGGRGHLVSRTKIEELCALAEKQGALSARDAFGGRGLFRLDRGAPLGVQARAAATYALGLPDPEAAARDLRTSVRSLRAAADGSGTWEYHLRLVAFADALWRPWTPSEARNELLVARAMEAAEDLVEAWAGPLNGDEAIVWDVQALRTLLQETAFMNASVWRRARTAVQEELGVADPARVASHLTPDLMLIEALDVRTLTPEARVAYERLAPMYLPLEFGLLPGLLSASELALDPSRWSPALQGAFGLTDPSRRKAPGDALEAARFLGMAAPGDPRAVVHLVRGRHAAQAGRLSEAAASFHEAVRSGAEIRAVALYASLEGLAAASAVTDWSRAEAIHRAAYRRDAMGVPWAELKVLLASAPASGEGSWLSLAFPNPYAEVPTRG